MEKWFLAGAVLALLILLFDKPLADEIYSQAHQPMPVIPGPPSAPAVTTTAAVASTCDECNCGSASAPSVLDSPITITAPLSSAVLPRIRPDGPANALIVIKPTPPSGSVQQLGNRLGNPPNLGSGYGW
jgi:hypothetical protein